MMAILVSIIVALIIAGFVLWAGRQLINIIPLDPLFKQVINVVLLIIAVAIIIFYVVIPLLQMLTSVHLPGLVR
jgi:hypothetical protein